MINAKPKYINKRKKTSAIVGSEKNWDGFKKNRFICQLSRAQLLFVLALSTASSASSVPSPSSSQTAYSLQ